MDMDRDYSKTNEEILIIKLTDALKPDGPTTQTNQILAVIAEALIEIGAQLEAARLNA
jgi:hypothetical protein